ncbi:MAG: hypothetical protein IPL16_02210 [Ignavibacteria bacterium]|nr:hypothetical protein [Ignavibacteria bacterium]
MFKKILFMFIVSLVFIAAVPKVYSQADDMSKVSYNIEGVFECDWNGKYYVRQIGNEILWFGEDDSVSPLWSNVAHGTITGNTINLIWGDVPKGSIMQFGKLVIQINSNDNFTLISQEGDNFGSSVWNRITTQ